MAKKYCFICGGKNDAEGKCTNAKCARYVLAETNTTATTPA